ncbi:MAG TPA: hypothetical protein PKY15_07270 [Methanoregulaceae archaeon]|nr:hypothetical protein [Methanoregulaceae archaeon]
MGNCSFFLERSDVIVDDTGRPVDLRGESATGREHPHWRVKPAGRYHDQDNQDQRSEGRQRGRRPSASPERSV